MPSSPAVLIHKRDLDLETEVDERLRASIEERCQELAGEFHEVNRFEITLTTSGVDYIASAHATGKNTDVATQAQATDPGPAADQVLDKIERQLRRVHDKRIFAQRRDAQKDPPKRRNA